VIYLGNGVVAPAGVGARWTGVALNDAITGERVAVEVRQFPRRGEIVTPPPAASNPLGAAAKQCRMVVEHREHPWRDLESGLEAVYWCPGERSEHAPVEPADPVNHPSYYGGDTTYEVIKVAEAWGFDEDAYLFAVLKYIGRPAKGDYLTDLNKALFYLKRKIARMEAEQAAAEFAGATAERSGTSVRPMTADDLLKRQDRIKARAAELADANAERLGKPVSDWAGKGFTAAQSVISSENERIAFGGGGMGSSTVGGATGGNGSIPAGTGGAGGGDAGEGRVYAIGQPIVPHTSGGGALSGLTAAELNRLSGRGLTPPASQARGLAQWSEGVERRGTQPDTPCTDACGSGEGSGGSGQVEWTDTGNGKTGDGPANGQPLRGGIEE
jgi:hypothetical protein